MKESFDPLKEAERRSDPQLVRYNETIGHDPSANADYAAYLRTRDFEDENGNIHDAKTSKFKKRSTTVDPYEADLINSAHTEALEENVLRDSSLDTLAKKVAEARQSGDQEAAAHAEDLFFDKFTAMAEKYGWEEDDDSANDTMRLDKNAPISRTTIDDRLARYGKIMYGEQAAQEASVETKADVERPVVDVEEKTVEKAELDAEPAAEKKRFDAAAEIAEAKQRLDEAAAKRAEQANEARNNSEQAKADRELIARVSTEGLEDSGAGIARVSVDGLDLDNENNREIDRVSTEGLGDDEVEPMNPAKNFLDRAKRALHRGKELYLRAAFEFGHTLDLAKDELTKRGGRKEGETQRQYERRMRRNGRNVALGIVALAGASLAAKAGAFDGLFDGGSHPTGSGVLDHVSHGGGPREINDPALYPTDALHVQKGEGLFHTFKEMGIPRDKWQEVLDRSGPRLVRMGEAYRDPSVGGFGLNGDGHLSRRALDVIANTARNVK